MLSAVVLSTMTRSNLEEKVYFNLYLTLTANHDGISRQEPGGSGEMLSTGLLFMACSCCFLKPPRTTFPGAAPATVAKSYSSHQSKKCSQICLKANRMEKLMTLACVKLKKKEREKEGVGKEGREKKEGEEK